MAMVMAVLVALSAAPETLTRPCTSVPSMVKNRRVSFSISLEYTPSSATCAYRSRRFSRGTRTWSNHSRPLSTPLRPALCPQSSMRTPWHGCPSSSRIGTSRQWTPCDSPRVTSWANTAAIFPSRAALPM
jgi:hypothetical protein